MQKSPLYIALSARAFLILQLCVGLSLALFLLFYPFMGGLYKNQSDLLLLESITGSDAMLRQLNQHVEEEHQQILSETKKMFDSEPVELQEKILQRISERHRALAESTKEKMEGAKIFYTHLPPLLLLYTVGSIAIPLALLFRKKEAHVFILFLPILSLALIWTNQSHGLIQTKEESLLDPNEMTLQLDTNPDALKKAFREYLVKRFIKEDELVLSEEKKSLLSEFRFNLERVEWIDQPLYTPFWERFSPFFTIVFFLWNGILTIFLIKGIRIASIEQSPL